MITINPVLCSDADMIKKTFNKIVQKFVIMNSTFRHSEVLFIIM